MKVNLRVPGYSLGLFTGFVVLISGCFFWFEINLYLISYLDSMQYLTPKNLTLSQIGLVLIPILSYVVSGIVIIITVNIFKPLNSFEEEGVISNLVRGFVWGLVLGIIVGLVMSIVFTCFLSGFIYGLATCLFMGLVVGLYIGLCDEFK